MTSGMYTVIEHSTATTSMQNLLDPDDENASKLTGECWETDVAGQVSPVDTPTPHPEIGHKTLRIWDNRYKSLAGFAAYMRWCLILGWKECMRLSAWLWRKSWTAEVCSFVFALVSLMGLFMTLWTHQGRPLPEWPRLITINSIVSLIALCMRIGVGVVLAEGISQTKWQWYSKPRALHDMERFDHASRSAWGSVRFLYCFRSQKLSYLAALGALSTIMISLTGFFVQQLVQFQDCLQPNVTAAPGVSKTNSYSRSGIIQDGIEFAQPFSGIVAAINVAIFRPVQDYTNVLAHDCTSGNCTFPADNGASFFTVGVTHQCEDVTSQAFIPDLPSRKYRNDSAVLSDSSGQRIDLDLETDNVLVTRTGLRSKTSKPSLTTIHMMIREGDPNFSPDIKVLRCSLFPSLNTYGVNITDSVLVENLIDSVPLEPYEPRYQTGQTRCSYLTVSTHTIRDGVLEECTTSKSDETSLNGTKPVEYHTPHILDNGTMWYEDKALYYPADCVWCFGQTAQIGTERYFRNLFDNQTLSWSGVNSGTYSSIYLRQLWQERNMTLDGMNKLMKDLATAMTAVVRTEGSDGDIWRAKGTMWVTTTCMHIKWPWIAFPVVTVALTGLFLILLMIENRGVDSQRLWKSSILATLLCEVKHDHIDETSFISKEAMMAMAKSTSVSIGGGKGMLKLVA